MQNDACILERILVLSCLMKGGTPYDPQELALHAEWLRGCYSLFGRTITFVIVSFFAPKKFFQRREEKKNYEQSSRRDP